jgi:hypothetical protein
MPDWITQMAGGRFNDPIEPMDLANMRLNGLRSLSIQCHQCRHEVVMNVNHLPDELAVKRLSQSDRRIIR